MKRRFKKHYSFDEYFINDNAVKRLYNAYLEKPLFNKILDKLVLFSIITLLMSLILSFLLHLEGRTLIIINTITTAILLVFALELLRDYVHSKTAREFFTKHWIDVFLIVFLSFYFLFITAMGFVFKSVDGVKPLVQDTKYLRAFMKLFGR